MTVYSHTGMNSPPCAVFRLLGMTQDLSVPAPIARYQTPHIIQNLNAARPHGAWLRSTDCMHELRDGSDCAHSQLALSKCRRLAGLASCQSCQQQSCIECTHMCTIDSSSTYT